MKFQGIDSDPLLEYNEPEKNSHCGAKDAFKGVQVYVVLSTLKKDGTKVIEMVRSLFGHGQTVIKIFQEDIGHYTLRK